MKNSTQLKSFRNFIFDWSGTLVDDLGPVIDSTNKVFSYYGKNTFSRDEFCSEFCLPFENFYKKFLPEVPMSDLEELYAKYFSETKERVFLLPGCIEILKKCKNHNIGIYLLSSIKKQHFEIQANELHLNEFFNNVYTEALDKREWINRVLNDNSLEVSETIFIGDMKHDIDTANFAGIFSVGVLTGYNSKEMLEESSPNLIVENLFELMKTVFS